MHRRAQAVLELGQARRLRARQRAGAAPFELADLLLAPVGAGEGGRREQAAQPAFETAAGLARKIIKQLVDQATVDQRLFNVNIPTAALAQAATIRVVPMSPSRYGDQFIKRQDPKGRDYFWATTDPPPQDADQETDLLALQQGCVTVTPLQYNLTDHKALTAAENWNLTLDNGPQ